MAFVNVFPNIIIERKFFNQAVNGEDFLSNTGTFDDFFKYNGLELGKAVYKFRISFTSAAGEFNPFTVTADNQIIRGSGS